MIAASLRVRVRLAGLAGALLLAACAPPQIYHGQLQLLDKGMSQAEVQTRLKLAPNAVYHPQVDGRQFEFDSYLMNNGMQTNSYLVAFENGKLVYWGYLDEFRRQPDAALGKAAGSLTGYVLPAPR
jgi:hypothetical protein